MLELGQINVNDRVLLHLSRFATDVPPEEFPAETTQAGIAAAVGISRTHVPRAVKGLIRDGLITEQSARVKGHERRMNVYVVTIEGLRKADDFWMRAQDAPFSIMRDGGVQPMLGRDLENLVGRRKAIAAISQMTDGIVVIDDKKRTPVRDLQDAHELGLFVGRDVELSTIDSFVESDRRVLVVLGNRGYGTTSLVRRFVDTREEKDVLWIEISRLLTPKDLQARIMDFAKKVNPSCESLLEALGLETALFIFDDYFSVSDELVEFFTTLVEMVDGSKVIITARQETPAYNWFYQKVQVDSGMVEELKIGGVDIENAKKILGNERIEREALRRIHGMTRGQPMALNMLRDGNIDALKKNSVFTPEEIRYMLFLKDQKE